MTIVSISKLLLLGHVNHFVFLIGFVCCLSQTCLVLQFSAIHVNCL